MKIASHHYCIRPSVSPSVRPSACPYVSARLPLDGLTWKLRLRTFMKMCKEIPDLIKIEENSVGHFIWRFLLLLLLPEWHLISLDCALIPQFLHPTCATSFSNSSHLLNFCQPLLSPLPPGLLKWTFFKGHFLSSSSYVQLIHKALSTLYCFQRYWTTTKALPSNDRVDKMA